MMPDILSDVYNTDRNRFRFKYLTNILPLDCPQLYKKAIFDSLILAALQWPIAKYTTIYKNLFDFHYFIVKGHSSITYILNSYFIYLLADRPSLPVLVKI